MSYKILDGCWCDIIALNVHAETEDRRDDTKDRFHGGIFGHFPTGHIKTLSGVLNAKAGSRK
jgi:hypothetical protein